MANLTTLRQAQQMVCEQMFPEYVEYNNDWIQMFGEARAPGFAHVEDKIWDQTPGKTLPTLSIAETLFTKEPSLANALQYWECALVQN